MPKVISRLTVRTSVCDHDGLVVNEQSLNLTTAEDLTTKIVETIISGDEDELARLLAKDFIYPEILKENAISRPTAAGYFEEEFFEDHYTQPLIEKLFLEDRAQLIRVVDALSRKNSYLLYRELFTSMRNADIDEKKACSWTHEMRAKILEQLDDLQAYGTQLVNKNILKGTEIQALARDLKEMTKHPSHRAPAKLPENLETSSSSSLYFCILDLKFKLNFAHKLHSIDNIINEQRDHGLKKIMTNILTILFSAGLLNLLHRAVYGNWLFFSETRSAAKVSEIEKTFAFCRYV